MVNSNEVHGAEGNMTRVRPFTHADVHRALQQPEANPAAAVPLNSYLDFFNAQDASISSIYGYSRVLVFQYEIDVVEMLHTFRDGGSLQLFAQRLHFMAKSAVEAHTQAYLPLRQAAEVFIAYGAALRQLKAEPWVDPDDAKYALQVIPLANRVTACAFRDIALHMLLSLAGGDTAASEQVLLTGGSFTALRTLYGVHVDANSSNLNSWRIGLMEELQVLTHKAYMLGEARQQARIKATADAS